MTFSTATTINSIPVTTTEEENNEQRQQKARETICTRAIDTNS
jgi:hypothetical protein